MCDAVRVHRTVVGSTGEILSTHNGGVGEVWVGGSVCERRAAARVVVDGWGCVGGVWRIYTVWGRAGLQRSQHLCWCIDRARCMRVMLCGAVRTLLVVPTRSPWCCYGQGAAPGAALPKPAASALHVALAACPACGYAQLPWQCISQPRTQAPWALPRCLAQQNQLCTLPAPSTRLKALA